MRDKTVKTVSNIHIAYTHCPWPIQSFHHIYLNFTSI